MALSEHIGQVLLKSGRVLEYFIILSHILLNVTSFPQFTINANMDSAGGPGASPQFSASDGLKSLDIRTKTIELTLHPMLQQVNYHCKLWLYDD